VLRQRSMGTYVFVFNLSSSFRGGGGGTKENKENRKTTYFLCFAYSRMLPFL
jgi:hypothetical protein